MNAGHLSNHFHELCTQPDGCDITASVSGFAGDCATNLTLPSSVMALMIGDGQMCVLVRPAIILVTLLAWYHIVMIKPIVIICQDRVAGRNLAFVQKRFKAGKYSGFCTIMANGRRHLTTN